jgi:hypothetical protein
VTISKFVATRICFSVPDSVYTTWRRISPDMFTVSAGSLFTKFSDQGYTQIATSDVTQPYLWGFKSSGIRCRVHWQVCTYNSCVLADSVCLCHCSEHHLSHRLASSLTLTYILYRLFRVDTPVYFLDPEEGDRKLLQNFDKHIQINWSHIIFSTYFSNV